MAKQKSRSVLARIARTFGIVLGCLILALVGLVATPILDPSLASSSIPTISYDDAVARINSIEDREQGLPLLERAHSYAMLTGEATETVVVLFHGYTNTPDEFRLIAQGYRDQGFNVWVPRLPHHGLADKFTDEFSELTAEALRDFADDQLDIAAGLGEKVLVMGLSGGGALALWAGLERPEVSQLVLVSPILQPAGYPDWAIAAMVRALRLSPIDSYAWWDPEKQADNVAGMIYPRYSLKGMAAFLGMRVWAEQQLAAGPAPISAKVLLIRNDGDPSIDADFNETLLGQLSAPGNLEVYRIPASAGLPHDIISPDPEFLTDAQASQAYGELEKALGIPLPDPLTAR